MNKIPIAIGILALLLFTVFLVVWRSEKGEISGIGTIKFFSFEGGFFGIITEKGNYLPLNLPEKFKKDGLKVWFKARIREGIVTVKWGKPIEILEIKQIEHKKNLHQIKVAILYERIGDGKWIGRSIEDEIKIFKETKADFIFRAFWRWSPCPEKYEDLPAEKRRVYELHGYSYSHLEESISKIKNEIPDVIICGAIPAQIIQRNLVWNPKTREIIVYPETWDLALDPSKWGINISKEEFQCRFGKTHFWIPTDLDCKDYSPEIASAYFPDITNPKFQELLLSWAERQIDAGVDAIWIDMLFIQAAIHYMQTKDFNHPAVKESYEAACRIVDEIHEYGGRKGKYILVGSWATAAFFPYPPPKLDFVTISPSSIEVREMKLDEEKWNERLKLIRKKFGNIPIFAFIDWAGTIKTPLGQFSQILTKKQQRDFLKIADEFFSQRDVIFIYPVHGGWMGNDAQILSFGKSRVYDSLAPEFQTYNMIRELAQSKAESLMIQLKDVKVAVEYTWLGMGRFYLNRSVEDDIGILKDLKTDWVYLGFRYKLPIPYSPSEEPGFFNEMEIREAERRGYTFSQLKEAIVKLRQEILNILFTGGLGIELFYSKDRDPVTGEIIDADKAWGMALDPQEYGFSISKEELQCWWAKKMLHLPPNFACSQYDYRKVRIYFPDINKEEVRKLYLHKAMKLIDCGVDVIWIDMLHTQYTLFYRMSRDINHPAIKQTFKSISELVDKIHECGFSKGKHVYVGSWPPLIKDGDDILIPPSPPPDYDYVVVSPSSEEVLSKKLNEAKWEKAFSMIREYMGEDIVILMRLDLGFSNSPLHVFSQKLSPEEQKEFLRYLDSFLLKNDVLFSYPVFGLDMGPWEKGERKTLSWKNICWVTLTGESGCGFPFYDSLAPEFKTYDTIKKLAQNRSEDKNQ